MYKVITIENKKIPMITNGSILIDYRKFFDSDMLGDYLQLSYSLKNNDFEKFDSLAVARMMWVCAYQANNQIKNFEDWLKGFNSPFSFYEHLDDFIKMMESSLKTNVKPKKYQQGKKK